MTGDRAGERRGSDGPPTGDDLHEAFDLVASESRFDILQSLWNAETDGEVPVSFSELHDRVDVRDSGQFNYHLDKLRPRFVRKADDGYELTYAGKQIVGAAVSGVYTDAEATSVDPMAVGDCPEGDCDGDLAASYGSGTLTVECDSCDLVLTDGLAAPPVIAATHDDGALADVFSRHLLNEIATLNNGFCPLCGGGVDRSVTEFLDDATAVNQDLLDVTYACRACGFETHGALGTALSTDPVVVAFLQDAGVNLRERSVWEYDWLFEIEGDIAGEDPVRVEAVVEAGDDRLDLALDGDLEIVDYSRT